MPEDYFRPRVQPSRGPAPTEEWPDPQPVDADSETVDPDDLLGSFEAVRRALDASREAELAQAQAPTHGNPADALSEEAPTRPTRRTAPARPAPQTAVVAATATPAAAAPAAPAPSTATDETIAPVSAAAATAATAATTASSPTDETIPPTSTGRAASAKPIDRTGSSVPTSELTPTAAPAPVVPAAPAAEPGSGRGAGLPQQIDPPDFAAVVPAAPPRPARPVPMPRLPAPSGPAPLRPAHAPRAIEAEPAAIARVAGLQHMAPAEYAEITSAGQAGRRPPGSANRRDGDKPRRGRGPLIAGIAVIGAIAFCAGAVVAVTSGHDDTRTAAGAATPGAAAPSATAAPTPETTRAVAWVEDSVGPTHVVACDPIVCGLLGTAGFSSSSLEVVAGAANLEQADVVVLTPQLRTQLGNEAGALVSPEPLAVFGSGAAEVEIAAVQLNGAATYAQNMAADRAGRRTAGNALLGDPKLTADASARALLANGLVDARVCALLALLTGTHSVTIAGFTPIGPGAGPDVPSAGVVIETVDGQPAAGASTAATGVLATIKAQQAPYRPMSAAPGALGGQQGLQVVYSQPGPLGLLPGTSAPPA